MTSGNHAEHPEHQPERWPRERSVEHTELPPVFGTSCPPRGLSGTIRKHAYAAYSEGQSAHWLLLMAADRVDTVESAVRSALALHPDNPLTETGIAAELSRHGVRSRLGRGRADLKHQWIDPVIVGGPWVLAGSGAWSAATRLLRAVRRR